MPTYTEWLVWSAARERIEDRELRPYLPGLRATLRLLDERKARGAETESQRKSA